MLDGYNQIEAYKKIIIDATNNCGLTIGTAYYVLKDVLNDIYLLYLDQKYNPGQEETHHEEVIELEEPVIITEEQKEEIKNETE